MSLSTHDPEVYDDNVEVSESTSLLKPDSIISASDASQPLTRQLHKDPNVIFIFVLFFMLECAAGMMAPGLTAVLEQRICDDVYPDSSALDRDCKSPEVQGRLATLSGWQYTMACIPGLIATVPYGMLSDKWGRRRVLNLAFAGSCLGAVYEMLILYCPRIGPVELVLCASMFDFIGGGPGVITAMIYTSLTDIIPIASRATVFLQLTAIGIISEIVSGALAGFVLAIDIWCLLWLSSGLLFFCLIMSLFSPETLILRKNDEEIGGEIQLPAAETSSIQQTFTKFLKTVQEGLVFIFNHGKLAALMLAFVFAVLSRVVQGLLLQYTTKKFGWSWSRASFLITIRSIASLITLIVLLPIVSHYLTAKLNKSPIRKDIWIARATGIAGAVGTLAIAFSPTSPVLIAGLIVLAFNGGMPGTIRSLMSTQVASSHMGTLNSMISSLDLMGIMITAPLFYGSLRKGIEWGGGWLGLPFMCAATLLSISTAIVFVLRLK